MDPLTWTDVAPLLARYHLALHPHRDDGSWDVLACGPAAWQEAYRIPFDRLPEAIAWVAERCEEDFYEQR